MVTHEDGILAANGFALAKLIDPQTLNFIVPEDHEGNIHSGESVAFWLANSVEGCEILAENDYALAKLINPQTLNTTITTGDDGRAGESVAFWLASTVEGRGILAENDYALAKSITPQTLNAIIPEGENVGESVAFWLASSKEGRRMLAENDFALAKSITPQTLNAIIPDGELAEKSVASFLASTNDGRRILAANHFELATKIELPIMYEAKYYDMLAAMIAGKLKIYDFKNSSSSMKKHFFMNPQELDSHINRKPQDCTVFLYCALIMLAREAKEEFISEFYISAIAKLLKVNFANSSQPDRALINIIKAGLPNAVIPRMTDISFNQQSLLNIARHLTTFITKINVNQAFEIVMNLHSRVLGNQTIEDLNQWKQLVAPLIANVYAHKRLLGGDGAANTMLFSNNPVINKPAMIGSIVDSLFQKVEETIDKRNTTSEPQAKRVKL